MFSGSKCSRIISFYYETSNASAGYGSAACAELEQHEVAFKTLESAEESSDRMQVSMMSEETEDDVVQQLHAMLRAEEIGLDEELAMLEHQLMVRCVIVVSHEARAV